MDVFTCSRLIVILIAFTSVLGQDKDTVINPPQNATKHVGDNITFTCDILETNYTGFFEWRKQKTGPPATVIYNMPPFWMNNLKLDHPDRFQRVAPFSLNISNLTLGDGAAYSCYFAGGGVTKLANLIVIEAPVAVFESLVYGPLNSTSSRSGRRRRQQPMLPGQSGNTSAPTSTPTSTPSSVSTLSAFPSSPTTTTPPPLQTSHYTLLQCTVRFGGPLYNGITFTKDQYPVLSMSMDDVPVTNANLVTDTSSTLFTKLTLVYKHNMSEGDVGKELECTVTTANPRYSDSATVALQFHAPAHWIHIYPLKTTYAVNDVLICDAEGYPIPYVEWTPITSPAASGQVHIYGSKDLLPDQFPGKPGAHPAIHYRSRNLTLTRAMIGKNKWNCTAYNDYNYKKNDPLGFNRPVYAEHSFTVVDSGTNVTQDQNSDNSLAVGLGVGLGLGIPVVVGLIILICCLLRRKKARDGKNGTAYKPIVPPTNGETQPKAAPIYKEPKLTTAGFRPVSGTPDSLDTGDLDQSGRADLAPRLAGGPPPVEISLLGSKQNKPPSRNQSLNTSNLSEASSRRDLPPYDRGAADLGGAGLSHTPSVSTANRSAGTVSANRSYDSAEGALLNKKPSTASDWAKNKGTANV